MSGRAPLVVVNTGTCDAIRPPDAICPRVRAGAASAFPGRAQALADALAGVVVNDSIILVDFVNKSIAEGRDIFHAVVESGMQRFRAIMLTSLTTFFGLLPILLETSMSAEFVTPMAVSLGFGILFATVITLILIPCLYVVINDLKFARHQLTTEY